MQARDMRVSDAEREHVGGLLQRAVGQGMLSLGEFTERMDTALAAKTRGELNSVLVDLPGMRLIGDGPAETWSQAPRAAGPVSDITGDAVIRGRLSSVTRKGPWNVPPRLYLNSRLCGVTLDFTAAVMQTQVVEIIVDDYCSGITLIVPDAATVNLNALHLMGASADNRVRTGPPMGPLHLVVFGRLRFGSITAKYPFGSTFRRLLG
ncbi:DUF1707 domain-containing protein [Skermania sp. ID1734]|uniref:DUF1707 SHOCT-like domain-containing protein n=1 Tax=Skermania sp. ID1734 TaxID=2597516 RepID=UPI00117DAE8C|nr:DUF1707 domain-containing protein [Skermania sp. ID1734]TSE00262.1 DUF1707 domain-containing protein [Skermania sp. ID1734]